MASFEVIQFVIKSERFNKSDKRRRVKKDEWVQEPLNYIVSPGLDRDIFLDKHLA